MLFVFRPSNFVFAIDNKNKVELNQFNVLSVRLDGSYFTTRTTEDKFIEKNQNEIEITEKLFLFIAKNYLTKVSYNKALRWLKNTV